MSSVLLLVALLAAPAQEPADSASKPSLHQGAQDYQVGPGDLLSIRVAGVREFDQSTRVSNSGRIRVPYVGVMFVAGMTTLQVEREVAEQIKNHELVSEPSVRVQVEEHRARPAYVIGEVNAPGQFVITGEMYLLDLLSKAGGLMGTAADKGFLYRRRYPQPSVDAKLIGVGDSSLTPANAKEGLLALPDAPAAPPDPGEVIEIDFDELRLGEKPELNVALEGGDILYVPRRRQENIYIIGDVTVPGAYTLPRRGQITAAQAIIYAGGPLKTANMGAAFVMRHDEEGVRQSIPVHFSEILEGKQPDIPVKAGDIVYIPNSTVKTIGVGFLNLVPTLIQQWLIF